MLSDNVSELGMEIRNQQDTVNIPLVEVKLLPGSLAWMLALFVKVAARAWEKRQATKHIGATPRKGELRSSVLKCWVTLLTNVVSPVPFV